MERDKQLDLYRGLSMIYVVCFIHVIYWLKIGSEPILSLMLFEMPIIFFISGASLSFRKEPRSFWNTLCSRFKRVVIPYYICSVDDSFGGYPNIGLAVLASFHLQNVW